jgi:NAD-dependent SIR2 family protein deacetylase
MLVAIIKMKCVKCKNEVTLEEISQIHYDGEGVYYYCPSCEAKNYIEEDPLNNFL